MYKQDNNNRAHLLQINITDKRLDLHALYIVKHERERGQRERASIRANKPENEKKHIEHSLLHSRLVLPLRCGHNPLLSLYPKQKFNSNPNLIIT